MSVNYEISDIFNYTYTGPISTTTTGGAGAAEVFTIDTTGAFAGGAQGEYFIIYSANDAASFYVWNDTAGDGTTGDPAPLGLTELAADTSVATNDGEVGSAIQTVINADAAFIATGPVAEVSTATIGVPANLEQGANPADYIQLFLPGNVGHYFWVFNGTTLDPGQTGTGHVVTYSATPQTLSDNFVTAINLVTGFTANNAGGTSLTVTITGSPGSVTDITTSDAVELAVAATTQGNNIVTVTLAATGNTSDPVQSGTPWVGTALAVVVPGSGAASANTGLLYRDAANDDEVRILAASATTGQVLTVTAANVIGWATPESEVSDTTEFLVHKSTAQTITSSGLTDYSLVTWDTEILDAGNNFGADVYTAPDAGTYWFNTLIKWGTANKSNKGTRRIEIVEDPAGTPDPLARGDQPPESNKTLEHYQTLTALVVASLNDVFGVRVSHSAGLADTQDVQGAATQEGSSLFMGFRIA